VLQNLVQELDQRRNGREKFNKCLNTVVNVHSMRLIPVWLHVGKYSAVHPFLDLPQIFIFQVFPHVGVIFTGIRVLRSVCIVLVPSHMP
jgi:hypothetical protein